MRHLTRRVLTLVAAAGMALVAVVAAPATGAFAATCGQPTHVWWATPGGALGGGDTIRLVPGSPAWASGIVPPNTSVFYFSTSGFFFANGQVTTAFSTTVADGNCVVHHDQNQIYIPAQGGPIEVYATYQRWEDSSWVTTFVGSINMG